MKGAEIGELRLGRGPWGLGVLSDPHGELRGGLVPGQPQEPWFVSGPGTQFGEDWRTVIGRHPADQGPWCPPGGPPGEQHPPTPRLRAPSVTEESLGSAVKCSWGPLGRLGRCSLALLGAGEQTEGVSGLSWAWSYCFSPRLHSPPKSNGLESFPPSRWGWAGQLPEAEKEVDRSAL